MGDRLRDRVCVITGTAGGMGRAAAVRFAGEGACVVGCDVNAAGAAATLQAVEAAGGSMVSLHPCDLTDSRQCQALVDLAVASFGRIDVLYNNAAMAYFGWVDQLAESDWCRTINEELHLVFLLTKAAWPELARRGGSIINTASVSAHTTLKVLPGIAHSAAKGAIVSMTRTLAIDHGREGIRANSICPGYIQTPLMDQWLEGLEDPEATMRDVMRFHPLGRIGTPADIAEAALFLASPAASWITGASLVVDGGMSVIGH